MKRALRQFACIFLLLVAQHSALTHSVWHLNDHLPAHQQHQQAGNALDQENDEGNTSESRLCGMHFAFGSVLGGNCASLAAVFLPDLTHWLLSSTDVQRTARAPASYRSRAPPVLL